VPGARFVEVPGADHLPFVGDQESILGPIEVFLAGAAMERPASREAVATVLSASFKAPRGELAPVARRLQKQVACDVDMHRGRLFRTGRNRLLGSFDGPARAVRCACAIARHAARLGIQARVGLHIGECSARARQLTGPAVDQARRIEARAEEGEILVSANIRDLIAGSEITFEERGSIASPQTGGGALRLLGVDPATVFLTPES
jgi:class 3 adenylate cyclase